MKKTLFTFVSIFLLFIYPLLPQENKLKVLDEKANNFGKEIDKSRIPRLRWVGPGRPGTYEEYIASFLMEPFFIKEIIVPPFYQKYVRPETQKILVISNSSVYSEISIEILLYVDVLKYYGYDVEFYECSGGTPEDLKSFITNKKNIGTSAFEVSP